ncbi:hypothetical protein BIW11_03955 [Tropilaelaps mercedesae]|uniref:Uncharacterized protein n=1 Tax=Tropilaelaps mercedesae TaxID=418985 RepID=A0A1V9XDB9_9ACAR|nr:hypothetical protein BIW11_03955 [Tropilaelaps mercedesae]
MDRQEARWMGRQINGPTGKQIDE